MLMHKLGILPDAFQKLWSDERLLNVAEQLVGPEIAGHPVWNLRCKVNVILSFFFFFFVCVCVCV